MKIFIPPRRDLPRTAAEALAPNETIYVPKEKRDQLKRIFRNVIRWLDSRNITGWTIDDEHTFLPPNTGIYEIILKRQKFHCRTCKCDDYYEHALLKYDVRSHEVLSFSIFPEE